MTLLFRLEDVPDVIEELDIIRSDDGKDFCYTFVNGKYKGISYVYGDLTMETNEDDTIQVDFVPLLLSNENDIEVDMDDFSDHVGQILNKVIVAALESLVENDELNVNESR